MSAKRDPDDDDDDEDDDELDFVPGADDDDDDDDEALDGDWEAEEDERPLPPGSLPPYIEGNLSMKSGCFEYSGDTGMRLISTYDIAEGVSLVSPAVKSIRVAGKLSNGGDTKIFSIAISKLSSPVDALDQKLLDAQAKKNTPVVGKSEAVDDDNEDSKKPAAASLKQPPSYSLKAPPSSSPADGKKKASSQDEVFTIKGTQVTTPTETSRVTFRGLFLSTGNASTHLICSVNTEDTTGSKGAASSPAAAKKRNRDDDDSEGGGDEGVDYQELIDLHKDAGLTPEQLRQQYYGGGASTNNGAGTDEKKPATADPSSESKRPKPTMPEDDDDDDYGF